MLAAADRLEGIQGSGLPGDQGNDNLLIGSGALRLIGRGSAPAEVAGLPLGSVAAAPAFAASRPRLSLRCFAKGKKGNRAEPFAKFVVQRWGRC